MNRINHFKLSILMFLQFFIWGGWYTSIAVYMTQEGMGHLTHWPYTVNPLAAIAAPFIVGLVADRFFATEKILGALHIAGGLLMFITPEASGIPTLFILLLLAYCLCYMPTMSLANTLVFHHINDQEKEFPIIRVFGTIGWIVAGIVVSFGLGLFVADGLRPEQTALPLYLTALASLILGFYSYSLPHTPPKDLGKNISIKSLLGFDTLKELGSRSFYIFLISSLLISIPLAAYFNFTQVFLNDTGFENIAATQTLGQASEVIFMILMPIFFVRLGVKWMLAAGMFAWIIRYSLFALGAPDAVTWMILTGIAIHGICYDFFYVTGHIYVDLKSSDKIRGQAQGLLVFLTYGVGMLIGAQISGYTFNYFLEDASTLTLDQWYNFWWVPAIIATFVLIFFVTLFNEKILDEQTTEKDINI